MSRFQPFTLTALTAAALATALGASAQTAEPREPRAPREPMAAGLIVKFKQNLRTPLAAGAAMQGFRASAEARGMAVDHEREGALGTRVLRLQAHRKGSELLQLARDLQASDATIEYVEPDWILSTLATPTDPGWADQWDMYDPKGGINAPAAWDLSQGFGVRVAVLDTGVLPHADLAANLLPGYDFVTSTYTARDGNGRDADASDPGSWSTVEYECDEDVRIYNSVWHGTHVAGTIAAVANNGMGYSGVAPKAKVQSVRVLGRCGSGATSDIAAGVIWAAGGSVTGVPANPTPARVLNLSLGGPGSCSTTMQSAIDSARAKGALVVVAAGNDNVNASTASPANCKGVMTIGATNKLGGKSDYSNWGDKISLSAPGGDSANGNVSSLYNNGTTTPMADTYAALRGTSMAAPHVAGTAALMMAINTTLTADAAAWLMWKTARSFPVACTTCGNGILDAGRAVEAARGWRAEREPNDTVATAQYMSVMPGRVWGVLEPTNTTIQDTYSVYLPANATLQTRLTMIDIPSFSDLTTTFDMVDGTGKVIKTAQQVGGYPEVNYYNNSAAAMTLYLRVRATPTFALGTFKSFRYELTFNKVQY